MSTAGVFTLISNDGKQDRLLMATSFLNDHLANVQRARARDPTIDDATPLLSDIERTHILFMNAHFKPFAAIGFEYNKVKSASGVPQLGGSVQFSIPQFGDFFHDMVLHLVLRQPTLTVTGGTADANAPLMRWCAYPGERAPTKVKFDVNGNPLDEYQSFSHNFHREILVAPGKKLSWDRCVGQETLEKGWVDQPNWVRNQSTAASITARQAVQTASGAQTPTGQKTGDLEMFIPLLFWFNKDVRLSVPSVSIPYGQRFVNIDLANQEDLVNLVPRGTGTWASPNGTLDAPAGGMVRNVELYVNNIFVNPEVHEIFIKRVGFSLIRVHRQQTQALNKSSDEFQLSQLKWPIEALCIGTKPKDYISTNAALRAQHLDKWHRFCQVTPTTRSTTGFTSYQPRTLTADAGDLAGFNIVLNTGVVAGTTNTLFSTEMAAGDKLVVGTAAGARTYDVVSVTGPTAAVVTLGVAALAGGDATSLTVLKATPVTSTVEVQAKMIDSLKLTAHGIPIYNDFPAGFFNAYLNYHYGGPNINAPEDSGILFTPFSLYPGSYQPSGHINLSRAREFYLSYTSSLISSSYEAVMQIDASAINFLLISDGSAVLRFST